MDLDHLLTCPYAQGSEQEDEGVELRGGQVLIPTEATAVKDVSKMSVSTLRKLPSSRGVGLGVGRRMRRERRKRRERTPSLDLLESLPSGLGTFLCMAREHTEDC